MTTAYRQVGRVYNEFAVLNELFPTFVTLVLAYAVSYASRHSMSFPSLSSQRSFGGIDDSKRIRARKHVSAPLAGL